MSHRLPFDLTVYSKAYQRRGPIGAPLALEGEAMFNGAGSCEFTLPADHPRMADLTAAGARLVVRYVPDDDTDVFLLSGRVTEVGGGGPTSAAWRRFAVLDDWSVLSDEVQCWPNPTGTIAQQGAATAYQITSGPAETVLLNVLAPNVARQGTSLELPASQGRGGTIRVLIRFHTVAERIMPLVDRAGLGVRVRQVGTTRQLQVFQPTTITQELTQASGVVVAGEYSVTAPQVTRVTVGAGGEGTARIFREKIDATREADHGVILPVFRDARDIPGDDPELEAQLTARMDEALAEGAPKASVKAELAEAGWFRLGHAYNLGDRVTVRLADGPPIQDYIRSIEYHWEGAEVRITPRVGEWADVSDGPMIRHVQALTRAVGDLEKR